MSSTSLERILVPTDLSQAGAAAVRWAALLQQRLGARLTFLHASQPWIPFDIIEGPMAYALQNTPEFRERLARDAEEFIRNCLPPVDREAAETRIVDDAPARAILDTADAIDASLIVMGTHGRTGWRRILLGSVAEKVVHYTDRAVLCVPPDTPPFLGRILCPVNFTPTARVALEEACTLAATFDAELLIVHVADPADRGADVEGEFTAWIDPSVRDRCRYAHLLATGHPAEETIRLAHESHADLIVLGSQHKRFADESVIGATTERVVRFAKRAVWVVRADDRS